MVATLRTHARFFHSRYAVKSGYSIHSFTFMHFFFKKKKVSKTTFLVVMITEVTNSKNKLKKIFERNFE